MKGITALALLKKHGLISQWLTLKHIKIIKNYWEIETWEEFIKAYMMMVYLGESIDLTERIYIPEVKFAIGGTMKVVI